MEALPGGGGSGPGGGEGPSGVGVVNPGYGAGMGKHGPGFGNNNHSPLLSGNNSPGGLSGGHHHSPGSHGKLHKHHHNPGGSGGHHSSSPRRRHFHIGSSSRNREGSRTKEFVHAEAFRPQRQAIDPGLDPDPEALILSSARPLVAPREKIKRTPSKEVDPEFEPVSEPQPTPVTVVGPAPPKFKIEIAAPTTAPSGFYIENIESRATVTTTTVVPKVVGHEDEVVITPEVLIQPAFVAPPPVISSAVVTPAAAGSPPQAAIVTTGTPRQPTYVTAKPVSTEIVMTSPVPVVMTSPVPAVKPQPSSSLATDMLSQMQNLPTQKLGPFIALICGGAFVSAAADLDPTYLIMLTSLASLIMFRVLRI